jgi:protein tyrosine/serine phosphatase
MRYLSILFFAFFSVSSAFAGPFERAEDLIPNFVEVSPGLYRGGNPMRDIGDKRGLEALRALGVKVVIDLQGADGDDTAIGWVFGQFQPGEAPENIAEEKRYLNAAGIAFANLPFKSYNNVNKREAVHVQEAVRMLAEASPAQPVFIHCEHGRDRTGLVVALHRMQNQGWTVKASHDEWVALGHDIFSWPITGRLDNYFFRVAEEGGFEIGL